MEDSLHPLFKEKDLLTELNELMDKEMDDEYDTQIQDMQIHKKQKKTKEIEVRVTVVAQARCKVLDWEDISYLHVSKRMYYTLVLLTMFVCHMATDYTTQKIHSYEMNDSGCRVPYVFYTLLAWYLVYYGIRPLFEGMIIGDRYRKSWWSVRWLWMYCFIHLLYVFASYHMFLPSLCVLTVLVILSPPYDIS